MNAPSVEEQRSTDFGRADVSVSNIPAKQWHGAEADRQVIARVHDCEVMEGRGEQYGDEQAHRASDKNARRLADDPRYDKAKRTPCRKGSGKGELSVCASTFRLLLVCP